jgi:hypothetical protein
MIVKVWREKSFPGLKEFERRTAIIIRPRLPYPHHLTPPSSGLDARPNSYFTLLVGFIDGSAHSP